MIYRMSIPDGKYEYVSPACTKITGYTPEEIYQDQSRIRSTSHTDFHDYFEKEWENLLSGKILPYYEYKIINKHGKTKWLNQRNALIFVDHLSKPCKNKEYIDSINILLERATPE